jgi:hypothetical protein
MTIDPGDQRRTATTVVLLRCGVLAGPLFIVTFLFEGLARPAYNPLRHPVSSLALGPNGWIQVVNFMVAGMLCLAMAVGLLRARRGQPVGPRSGAILIGAVGVGLLGAGAFITDPVSGYPPGTPDLLASYTTSGALHDAFSVPVFLGLPAAALAYAWWFLRHGDRGWAGYSLASGLALLVSFGLTSAAFSQAPQLVGYGGLLQRTSIAIGLGWLTLLGIHAHQAVTSHRAARINAST